MVAQSVTTRAGRASAELEEREAGVEARARELEDRSRAAAAREQLARREAPVASVAPRSASGRVHQIDRLEDLVASRRGEFPERAAERDAYLFELRGRAGADGTLPAELSGLVADVFEPCCRFLRSFGPHGTLLFVRGMLIGVLAALALALVPATEARSAGQLPTRGIFVPGVSLAGVHLGYTQAQVKAALGSNYRPCTTDMAPSLCKEPLWLFEYTRGEPLGVAVKFHNAKVSAIFTLGAIQGWKTREGLKMYDPVSNIYSLYELPIYTKCIGFEAFSMRKGTITSSIYTASGVVYGFALTAQGEAICQ